MLGRGTDKTDFESLPQAVIYPYPGRYQLIVSAMSLNEVRVATYDWTTRIATHRHTARFPARAAKRSVGP
ncbi:hypothetical protein JOF56_004994 [Kibdelosporangium banguiense]|uniref:Uncharacterized protein n=1 Tax=Kibdelosporangium banguiense TaxID=1365924 RepID=A0ABS4TKS6_9PSEU|nr:hypothetical protein [Kibdelosporangium banguiense]